MSGHVATGNPETRVEELEQNVTKIESSLEQLLAHAVEARRQLDRLLELTVSAVDPVADPRQPTVGRQRRQRTSDGDSPT